MRNKGFTLIELATVLTIIGLIVAAVMSGVYISQSAEVRSLLTEQERYQSTVQAFVTKYNSLPGDMSDADTIWPTGVCGGSLCCGGATCNGNENGQITWSTGTEGPRAWRQIELSGLDTRVGGMSGTGANAVIGTNVPQSSYTDGTGGYYFEFDGAVGGLGNYIGFGRADGAGTNNGNILKPGMAYEIDKKIDDGIPNLGRVRGEPVGAGVNQCGLNTVTPAVYDMAGVNITCNVRYKLNTSL